MRNSGTCAWDAGFKFAFIGGDAMSGTTYALPQNVPANTEFDISINMTAPSKTGAIRGKWRISTAAGQYFGDEVYVLIPVGGAPCRGQPQKRALPPLQPQHPQPPPAPTLVSSYDLCVIESIKTRFDHIKSGSLFE
ncbi:NBR1-Ig-like domain-containing protein [Candidatus Villigracilis saccharophilus]|uniref:NBR1-Ig-like domain-containing protein n=1 Tax=Candidatus Villigracilis saccharophilus TaxID=3140684 RepID=UPI003135F418|nr:hypothetical protein [Anaerolineales bacterium]